MSGSLTVMFSVLTVVVVPSTNKLPVTVTLFADKSPLVDISLLEKLTILLESVISPSLNVNVPNFELLAASNVDEMLAVPLTVKFPLCIVPEVDNALFEKSMAWLESVIFPSSSVRVPILEPDAALTVDENKPVPVTDKLPVLAVPVVLTFCDPNESDVPDVVMDPFAIVTLPIWEPVATDIFPVDLSKLSLKSITLVWDEILPSLTVILPNFEPEAAVTVPDAVIVPVTSVVPTLRLPVVERLLSPRLNALVALSKVPSVMVILPNLDPEPPWIIPLAVTFELNVAVWADIDLIAVKSFVLNEIDSLVSLILPSLRWSVPVPTVIPFLAWTVPSVLIPPGTVNVPPIDKSPVVTKSLVPISISPLVEDILPLEIVMSPAVMLVPTLTVVETLADPVTSKLPESRVPVVDKFSLSKLILPPPDLIELLVNVRLPIFALLVIVTSPCNSDVPVTDKLEVIVLLDVTVPVLVVILPDVERFVVPKDILPSLSWIDPSVTVRVPVETLLAVISPVVTKSLEPTFICPDADSMEPTPNVKSATVAPVAFIFPDAVTFVADILPLLEYITALLLTLVPGELPSNKFNSWVVDCNPSRILISSASAVIAFVPKVILPVLRLEDSKSPEIATLPDVNVIKSISVEWPITLSYITSSFTSKLFAVTFLLVVIGFSVLIVTLVDISPVVTVPNVVIEVEPSRGLYPSITCCLVNLLFNSDTTVVVIPDSWLISLASTVTNSPPNLRPALVLLCEAISITCASLVLPILINPFASWVRTFELSDWPSVTESNAANIEPVTLVVPTVRLFEAVMSVAVTVSVDKLLDVTVPTLLRLLDAKLIVDVVEVISLSSNWILATWDAEDTLNEPMVFISSLSKFIVPELDLIIPLVNVKSASLLPDAAITIPFTVASPDKLIAEPLMFPAENVPVVTKFSLSKSISPDVDLILPSLNVISANFEFAAPVIVPVVDKLSFPKLIAVPLDEIEPLLIVIFPNTAPESPVITSVTERVDVTLAEDTSKAPVVLIPSLPKLNKPLSVVNEPCPKVISPNLLLLPPVIVPDAVISVPDIAPVVSEVECNSPTVTLSLLKSMTESIPILITLPSSLRFPISALVEVNLPVTSTVPLKTPSFEVIFPVVVKLLSVKEILSELEVIILLLKDISPIVPSADVTVPILAGPFIVNSPLVIVWASNKFALIPPVAE